MAALEQDLACMSLASPTLRRTTVNTQHDKTPTPSFTSSTGRRSGLTRSASVHTLPFRTPPSSMAATRTPEYQARSQSSSSHGSPCPVGSPLHGLGFSSGGGFGNHRTPLRPGSARSLVSPAASSSKSKTMTKKPWDDHFTATSTAETSPAAHRLPWSRDIRMRFVPELSLK